MGYDSTLRINVGNMMTTALQQMIKSKGLQAKDVSRII